MISQQAVIELVYVTSSFNITKNSSSTREVLCYDYYLVIKKYKKVLMIKNIIKFNIYLYDNFTL